MNHESRITNETSSNITNENQIHLTIVYEFECNNRQFELNMCSILHVHYYNHTVTKENIFHNSKIVYHFAVKSICFNGFFFSMEKFSSFGIYEFVGT